MPKIFAQGSDHCVENLWGCWLWNKECIWQILIENTEPHVEVKLSLAPSNLSLFTPTFLYFHRIYQSIKRNLLNTN